MNEITNEEIERISQKLFGKAVKDIKWLMLTNYVHKALIENEDCLRTGLYSWIPVFNGEVKHYSDIIDKSELKKYDIIHVNLSGQDVHLVGEIREVLGENSKTKLVINNDYTIELWTASFDYLPTLRREISGADMVFGTEPNQVGTLETLISRHTHLIPHPCFVKRLKTLKPHKIINMASIVSHRYDNHNVLPSLAIKDLGLGTRLIGYDESGDRRKFVTTTCYNAVMRVENYMAFCEQLMESKVVVDPFTLTSVSRTGWDCAALGVPLVGSDRNYSVQQCFPRTMVPPYNMKKMREMVKKLLNDDKFRQEVIEYARNKVEEFGYLKSKEKYFKALEEGSKKVEI